jgi:hypothetical protein
MFLPYENGGLDAIGEIFMLPYESKYGVSLNQEQFAVGAAIAYIRKLGWNRETGPASDGSGGWATFEEKYTQLAIHEIQGYLADRVSYKDHGTEHRLTDYGRLFHIPNPADHDSALRYHYYHVDAQKWFIPEEMAEPLVFDSKADLKQIRAWTTTTFTPNFQKWIYSSGLQLHGSHTCNDNWAVLYSSTSFPEPNRVGRGRLRIACVLVDEEEFEDFKSCLQNSELEIDSSDISPADLRASISGGVYHSVSEVVLSGKHEEDSEKWISSNLGDYQVYATITELHESKVDRDGDVLSIPARLIRSHLDIRTTDGRGFFNAKDELVVLNFRNKEDSYTEQDLTIIDRTYFEMFLKEKKMVPVWFVENYRSTIPDSKYKERDDHWQNCTKWVVWGNCSDAIELHNDEHC